MRTDLKELIALAQKQYEMPGNEENIATAEQIITIATEEGDISCIGYGCFYLGAALWDIKKFPEAIEKLAEAISLSRQCNNESLLAKTFYLLGCCYREVKMGKRALEYLDDSTSIYEMLSSEDNSNREWKMAIARNLTISGQTLLVMKQVDKAKECHQCALNIRQQLGYDLGIASSKSNLGFVCIEKGEFERARILFEEASESLKKFTNLFHYYQALTGLGIAQVALQEREGAIANFEFVLGQTKNIPAYYSVYDMVLKHLPPLYAAKGDYTAAYELTTIYATHRQQDYDHAYVDAITLLEAEQGKAKREQQLQEAKHESLKMNLTALRSQMDPHFIFNLLHSVSNKIESRDSSEAKNILEKFALLMRQNLELAINESITLEDEIDFLRNYISLELLRMGSKFTYSIEIDEDLETELIRLPGMLIQPYVENAIKHGLMPLEESGKLEVTFKQVEEDALLIIIRDNGIGIGASELRNPGKKKISGKRFESHGMSITGKRISAMNALYEEKVSVAVNDLSASALGTGTEVLVTIKI